MTANVLITGDSKSGKTTTTLLGLLQAGFEVFVADFDNGAEYVLPYLETEDQKKRLHIVPLRDKLKWADYEMTVFHARQGKKIPKKVRAQFIQGTPAIERFWSLLDNWKEGDQSFGSPFSWDPGRVLIIDSGTEMGEAIVRYKQNELGRSSLYMRISDWSAPQGIELAMLSDLISASCSFAPLYHLKHIRPPSLVDADVDAIMEAQEAQDKKGDSSISSTVLKQLWPTGIGEKNARYGVPKGFSLYISLTREDGEDQPKLLLRPTDQIPVSVPLPLAKKKELERLPPEKALGQLFTLFAHPGSA